NYAPKDPDKLQYISSFAGYFPADNPKYSCIVVIHEPDKNEGYYGADVSGPVFKTIAQKIYANSPQVHEINNIQPELAEIHAAYDQYMNYMSKNYKSLPKVKGMSGMDAIALLENHGYKVQVKGMGKVVKVLQKGNKNIVLQLS
ncbi:MAG: penicillin-binding transpeptidase domain-containing protein, partial [Flavobacteriaceae bacterium]|nr:penicillin-binding transpeptidase domain-containing protein [Flavobacteriaceae bacterium]